MAGIGDVLAILFLLFVFYLLGFRIVRKSHNEEQQPEPSTESSSYEIRPLERRQIVLDALNQAPFTDVLSPRQRDRVRYSLLNPDDTWTQPVSAHDFEPDTAKSPEPAEPMLDTTPAFVPPIQAVEPAFKPASEPQALTPARSSGPVAERPTVAVDPPSSPSKPPRTPVMDTIRASWDPAVMMLYLGALLVVVAGLIFATYNWGTLGGWQKMGMLSAGTFAFLIAGVAIRNIERVKPASTTFIVIGGLLVPANFLAAYTVFDDVQPVFTLLIGALSTTVVHALLSFQPGAQIFRYSAVGAVLVAVATIPAALGFEAGWGGVVGLAVIALMPPELPLLRRFQSAWDLMSKVSLGPLAAFAIWQGWESNGWMIAGALIGVSMAATQLSKQYPAYRPHLLAFADFALILASMQIAHNFSGEQWIIAAGLLALTLLLIQEARRFPQVAHWLEFAATISAALFAGEVVRVLGTNVWALAIASGVLAVLMLLHARRHPDLAFISEAIVTFVAPVSLGTAVYAIDPSLWSGVAVLAALTGSTVWLGLRRDYFQNWPGFVSAAAAIGSIVVLFPAIGPDWGWGGVAALMVIGVAPYPSGRLVAFSQPWMRMANAVFVPITLLALWRGLEINDWLIPVTLVAVSMWFTRMALESVADERPMLVLSDIFAILAAVSAAWVLRDDRWLLAAILLAIGLVLIKRSVTWPAVAGKLQFVVAFVLSAFVVEITHELVDPDWALAAGALALTLGMLTHSRLHPRSSWISEFIAVWSLPLAIAAAMEPSLDSWWWVPISAGALTLTLVAHRIRHSIPGDINLAIASLSGVLAIFITVDLLGIVDSSRNQMLVLIGMGLVLAVTANVWLPQYDSVSGWLKNLLRAEILPLFFIASAIGDFENAAVLSVVILVMFWNIWASRQSFWSVPLAVAMLVGLTDLRIPSEVDELGAMWWYVVLAVSYAALAWQLDRKTKDAGESLPAGVYLWMFLALVAGVLVASSGFLMTHEETALHSGIALTIAAGLHWIGFRSTGGKIMIGLAGLLVLMANVAWIFGKVSSAEYVVLAAISLALAVYLYWRVSTARIWIGFLATVLGLIYVQLATDLTYTNDLVLGLVAAWVLVSTAIVRWRSPVSAKLISPIFYQAMLLHPLAHFLPVMDHSLADISRSDLVLTLVSLAGVVATFGSLRRRRELVLIGSAIGMTALMLQINLGSPGNLHAYTVPLSIYLLAVGLLMRRDARIANLLLTVGSAILVIPALVEALTTGEIVWLWVALAESIGLFLFGTILRLRIPTAAGIIAVSVILLRMLVFAVSVLASWISILAIGVALLLIGTMWLLFRDAIQHRATALFSRWRSFD